MSRSRKGERLRVFISSTMTELRDVRDIIDKALDEKGINARVYENSAGARPVSVRTTSLDEVRDADVYVGLFWQKYGAVTIEEYQYARTLKKPCFTYIRDKGGDRDPKLQEFLKSEIYDLQRGVTYAYFDSAVELGEQLAEDIMTWLVSSYREMTAEIAQKRISQDDIAHLQAQVNHLQATTRNELPQGTPVDYLAQQLRGWFRTLNYTIHSHEVRTDSYFEWLIDIPKRRGFDHVLVRGIDGEVQGHHVRELREALSEHDADEGWLVAQMRVSQVARKEAEKRENRNIACYTLDELLDENADFTGYLNWLEKEIKRRKIDEMYVPLACTKGEFDPITKENIGVNRYDEKNGWIDGYIDRWLGDPSKEHISILGEFGTGKTWFTLHYAWTALQRYREAKAKGTERPRLPLIVPLRDYAKAVSIESLFSEFFFRRYQIPLPHYAAFEQLNRMGKLLLIFDGFDEMADRIDKQKMINNFWELARVVVGSAKVILTCRTEHFPEAQEGRALLNAELQASTSNLTGQPPQFEVLDLQQFTDEQVRRVLSYRTDPATVERIMSNRELLDLTHRPLMTELVLDALPEISEGKPVDLSRVYMYATRRKMERDIKDERTFTSLADKLYFMCELSWEMLSTDQMSLNYRLFPDRLRTLFGPVVQEQKDLDHWQYDMWGQTMLIRNFDGDYTPAHRSLLEFFAAYKLAAELGILAPDFLELAQSQNHVDPTLPAQEYTWSSYFHREMDNQGHIKPIAPITAFIPEKIERLTTTLGTRPLAEAILALMQNMIVADKDKLRTLLLDRIYETRGKTTEEVSYVGANCIAILTRRNLSALKGLDLSMTNLPVAYFNKVNLTDCNLRGANLRGASFTDLALENVDMREADLTDTRFNENTAFFAIAFSRDGKLIAGGGHDWTISIWDSSTGRKLHTLKDHLDNLSSILWYSNNKLITNSTDGTTYIRKSKNFHIEAEISSIVPSHRTAISPNDCNLAVGRDSGIVEIWDLKDWQPKFITQFDSGNQHAYALDFPYDNICISSGWGGGVVKIFDITRNTVLKQRKCFDGIYQLRLSPDKKTLAVVAYAEGFALLRADNLEEIWRETPGGTCWDLTFSPTSNTLLIGAQDHGVIVVDSKTGNRLTTFKVKGETYCVTISPDGTLAVSASSTGALEFWDARPFVTLSGEPHINIVEYVPPDLSSITSDPATWPQWWQQCKIAVLDNMVPNPDFGKCLRTIQQKMNCEGLQLQGAIGIERIGIPTSSLVPSNNENSHKRAVTKWLRERGAILSDRQRTKKKAK